MEYARDLHNGEVVAAENASPLRSYACPRPGCGGRVYLPKVVIQRPHFRHYPGQGTTACDEYVPGIGSGGNSHAGIIAAVEEGPSELGLLLTQLDGCWGLGLRLPEIPSDELGETSLKELLAAQVDVYAGRGRLLAIGALDLRPGVGAARVDVVPSLQAFRTQPVGSWPSTIEKERWLLESRGLEAKGALFRLRRGEWTRLLAGSGVHHGETLLVLADTRCTPAVVSEAHAQISSGGLKWTIWEVQLPSQPDDKVTNWLARLGHQFVPRPWSLELATPARAHSSRGEPIFWVGDSPVLTLEAPQGAAATTVAFQSGSNSDSAGVRASQSRVAHVGVKTRDAGLTRLTVASERSASLDIAFVERPARTAVLQLLVQTPRLRVHIGEQILEAWQGTAHSVRVPSRELPEVRVDLGPDSARARITVWERGKQRSRRGLDARGAGRAVEEAIASASRIEVDADSLGRVVILPVHQAVDAPRHSKGSDRLAWRDLVVSQCSRAEERTTPTMLEQPRAATSLAARQVDAAGLVRARLALRRRHEAGGTRP